MEICAFNNECKDIMDWITNDKRVHPEVTYDVLKKRIKRGWVPELALTTPVIKGNLTGDSRARKKAREDKMVYRFKMFRLAQEIRRKHGQGVEQKEIMDRYAVSKSQVEKAVSKSEWFNVHFEGASVPDHFKEIQNIVET